MDDGWYRPDDESWHGDEDYNPAVADALRCAHESLAANPKSADVYASALACLEFVIDAPMSKRQRLAYLFVRSLALATYDPPSPALDPLDEALELAIERDIGRAQEDLLLLRASVNHAILQVPDAIEDLRDCLGLIAVQAEHRELTPAERDTRLQALLQRAGHEFLVGDPESCEQLLDRAAVLIPQVPGNLLAPSTLAWTRALLLRWRGQYEVALHHAMAAAEGYARHGAPGMTSRIQGIVADIALDLAERAQHNGQELAPRAFLDIAERYLQSAIEVAAAADFESSQTMAFITHARLRQLQHEPGDRSDWLQELADLSLQHADMAVAAQAYTQLGREHEAIGDDEAASAWYTKALAVLKESQLSALGIWAQRGLWRIQGEMSPDERP
ncbi:MAG TPA: hypothetical protein VFU88_02255 [Ktedonobacterales bacterium]|nr:hypothetical protein [Ktedonobacterales bacterium]